MEMDKMKSKNIGNVEDGKPTPALSEPEKPVNIWLWRLMLLMGVAIYGSYTIFVHLCEVDGKMPFSSASMVLLTEITKLILSLCMFVPEVRAKGFQMPPLSFVIPFAVPAVLYCINNNLCVHMQLQMDPATYQVLCNLKILSTAFLYRLIIKRPITPIQWSALGMLAVAGAFNSYGGFQAKSSLHDPGIIHITFMGLVMISCYCFISGLSGVYTEYVLKRHYQTSLHLQNSLLYMFGITLNGGAWFFEALYSNDAGSFNLFKGYSRYTVLIILSQAMIGLIMSAVMKHANNIVRLFLISTAMVVTTILSMLIFHLQLNGFFCSSFVLVFIALAIYHKN